MQTIYLTADQMDRILCGEILTVDGVEVCGDAPEWCNPMATPEPTPARGEELAEWELALLAD